MTGRVDEQPIVISHPRRISDDGVGAIIIAVDGIHEPCHIKAHNGCQVRISQGVIQRQSGHTIHMGGVGSHIKVRDEGSSLIRKWIVLPRAGTYVTLDSGRLKVGSYFLFGGAESYYTASEIQNKRCQKER